MASFKSILNGIWHGFLSAEPTIETAVKVLLPASAPIFALIDPVIAKIQNTIVTVEANSPDGTPGKDKFAAVIGDFRASLDLANSVLAVEGKQLIFDEASFTAATNAQVEAFRQFAVLRASVHVVDIPKASAPVVNQ